MVQKYLQDSFLSSLDTYWPTIEASNWKLTCRRYISIDEFKILFCFVQKNNINHKNLGSSSGYLFNTHYWVLGASLVAQLVKNPRAMRETWVQSLGWEDSPGEEKGYPLQYSGLENSMDYAVHGVAKNRTQTEWLSLSLSF